MTIQTKSTAKNFPASMKKLRRWITWELKERQHGKKPAKVPSGRDKGCNWLDPKQHMTFDEAVQKDSNHLGFVLGDGIVGIDIDNAIDDFGNIKPAVEQAIKHIPSTWGEISYSSNGFHYYLFGEKPEGMPCKSHLPDGVVIEVYGEKRYFAATGNQIPNTPSTIAEEDGSLMELWMHMDGGSQPRKAPKKTFKATLSEGERKEAFFGELSSNPKMSKLFFTGDTSDYDDDWSRADLALCNKLAFFMQGDAKLVDDMFRQSALYRGKWDEKKGKHTYGENTIRKAIDGLTEIYWGKESRSEGVLQKLLKALIWIKDLEVFVEIHRPHQCLRKSAVRDSYRNRLKNADTKILDHPERLGADNLGFLPGQGRIVETSQGRLFNQWRAPAIVPRKANVDVFYEAMAHTYPNVDTRNVIIWYMAHTVVRPEVKIRWALAIIGVVEGSGKSIWFDVAMKELVGVNHFRAVTQSDI